MIFAALKHAARVVHATIREATKARSPEWPTVRRAHLKLQPLCAACASDVRMQVHHKEPFHLDPALELDPDNLISLCMGPNECHIRIGHGDDFKAYNPNVVSDASRVLMNPALRPLIEVAAKANRLYAIGGA